MALYKHANGAEHDIDLDAAGPVMRENYERQIAAGELSLVQPAPAPKADSAPKKQAAKPADAGK